MPRYSQEFRKETLSLLTKSGRSVNAVSKELGISDKTLAQWKEEAEPGRNRKGPQAGRGVVYGGSGHPSDWLRSATRLFRKWFLLRGYKCPACGTENIFTPDSLLERS